MFSTCLAGARITVVFVIDPYKDFDLEDVNILNDKTKYYSSYKVELKKRLFT